jgi:hypothetical protein
VTPHVTLTNLAAYALALDDVSMHAELHLTLVASRKGTMRFEAAPEDLAFVLDDLLSRSTTEQGWDQPASAMRACRRAYPRAVAEIEAQGYVVKVGAYGRVTISPRGA